MLNNMIKGFIEVKGVTLEEIGIVLFPDASTTRYTKHLLALIKTIDESYTGTIMFGVQMKGCCAFAPHREMAPAFMQALQQALHHSVKILAYDGIVKEDELTGIRLFIRCSLIKEM